MSKTAHPLYQSFIVRCWLVPAAGIGETTAWRFELVDVSVGPHGRAFTELDQIMESMLATLQEKEKS